MIHSNKNAAEGTKAAKVLKKLTICVILPLASPEIQITQKQTGERKGSGSTDTRNRMFCATLWNQFQVCL